MLLMEFNEQDSCVLDEIMEVVKRYPDFERLRLKDALGNESNTIKCHIRNLREKLYTALPDAPFTIRCEREVGYCFELNIEHKRT